MNQLVSYDSSSEEDDETDSRGNHTYQTDDSHSHEVTDNSDNYTSVDKDGLSVGGEVLSRNEVAVTDRDFSLEPFEPLSEGVGMEYAGVGAEEECAGSPGVEGMEESVRMEEEEEGVRMDGGLDSYSVEFKEEEEEEEEVSFEESAELDGPQDKEGTVVEWMGSDQCSGNMERKDVEDVHSVVEQVCSEAEGEQVCSEAEGEQVYSEAEGEQVCSEAEGCGDRGRYSDDKEGDDVERINDYDEQGYERGEGNGGCRDEQEFEEEDKGVEGGSLKVEGSESDEGVAIESTTSSMQCEAEESVAKTSQAQKQVPLQPDIYSLRHGKEGEKEGVVNSKSASTEEQYIAGEYPSDDYPPEENHQNQYSYGEGGDYYYQEYDGEYYEQGNYNYPQDGQQYVSQDKQYGNQDQQYGSQDHKSQDHGTQDQQYGSQDHGTRDQQYGSQDHGTQDQQYGSQDHGTQDQQYGSQDHGTQDQQYGNQDQQYGSQDYQYGNQDQQYDEQQYYYSESDYYYEQGQEYGQYESQQQNQEQQGEHQGQEPQPYPQGQEPQPYPQGQEPQPYPQGQEPQPYPQGQEPQPYPYGQEPQPYPQGQEPQLYPQGQDAQSYPQGQDPQQYSQEKQPHDEYPPEPQHYPQGQEPQPYSQGQDPQSYPQGQGPQPYPQGQEPQPYPPGQDPQPYTQGQEPQPYPLGQDPQPYTQGQEPQPYTQGQEPQPYTQGQEPQPYPQGQDPQPYTQQEPQPYPQGQEPQAYPQGQDPQPYTQGQGPQPYPQGQDPQSYPEEQGYHQAADQQGYYGGEYQGYPTTDESGYSSGQKYYDTATPYSQSSSRQDWWKEHHGYSNPQSSYGSHHYHTSHRHESRWGQRGEDRGHSRYRDYGEHSWGTRGGNRNSPHYSDSYEYKNSLSPSKHPHQETLSSSSKDPRAKRTRSQNSLSESDRYYTKSTKYSSFNSSFVQKRQSMLKQMGSRNKQRGTDSKGPRIVQPHSLDAPANKKKKDEVAKPAAKPSNFPGESTGLKKSLSSFKIPKRKSSETVSSVSSPVKPTVKIPALDISEKEEKKEIKKETAALKNESENVSLAGQSESSATEPSQETTTAMEPQGLEKTETSRFSTSEVTQTFTTSSGSVQSVHSTSSPVLAPTVPQALTSPVVKGSVVLTSVPSVQTQASVLPSSGTSKTTGSKGAKSSAAKVPKAAPAKKKMKEPVKNSSQKTKDFSTLLQTLNPSILQSLAATIQQTLEAAGRKSPATTTSTVSSGSTTSSLQSSTARQLEAATVASSKSAPRSVPSSLPTENTIMVNASSLLPPHFSIQPPPIFTTASSQHQKSKKPAVMAMVVKPAEKLGKGAAGAQTKKNVETVEMTSTTPALPAAPPPLGSTSEKGKVAAVLKPPGQSTGIVVATVVKSINPAGTAITQVPNKTTSASTSQPSEKQQERESAVLKARENSPVKIEQLQGTSSQFVTQSGNIPSKNSSQDNPSNDSTDKTSSIVSSDKISELLLSEELESEPGVFVDANFRVMFKEYNLRRSRSQMNTLLNSPAKKMKIDTSEAIGNLVKPENSISLNKRQRSPENTMEDQTAKKLKFENIEAISKPIEVKQMVDASSPKTSPRKSGRGRKSSLSQTKASRKKQQIGAVQKTASAERLGDKMIVCAFCSKGDSSNNLGFLYGPYKPPVTAKHENESSGNTQSTGPDGVDKPVIENATLWVHEDCAVWSPGVCIVNGKLLGLHEAAADGEKLVCRSCKVAGATLCCNARGCKAVYHYPCARETGCSFKEEQFLIACPKHKLPS